MNDDPKELYDLQTRHMHCEEQAALEKIAMRPDSDLSGLTDRQRIVVETYRRLSASKGGFIAATSESIAHHPV